MEGTKSNDLKMIFKSNDIFAMSLNPENNEKNKEDNKWKEQDSKTQDPFGF